MGLIKQKQKLYATHYVEDTEEQKCIYKQFANKLTKMKKNTKKQYLQDKIVHSRNDICKFWIIIKSLTPQKPKFSSPNWINTANGLINNTDAIAKEFNYHFCGIGKKLSDIVDAGNSPLFNMHLTRRVSSSMFFSPVTSMEVYNTINLLNSNKSCGSDGIDVTYLRSAAAVIAPVLALLCNACLTFGIFPSCLKISKVIPIFKAGDKTNVTNYRPISLQSFLSKILEKLAYSKTTDFLNHENVLIPTQYGFRKNYSTSHAIIDILSTCYDDIENKLYSGLVQLDLAKAFDTVDHYILLQKLHHYG